MMDELEHLLAHHGVRPTANRLVIARALQEAGRPLCMTELEDMLETIDKSNIFRTLTAFRDAHPEFTYLVADGVPCAVKIYDAESGEGAAVSLLTYPVPKPDPSMPVEVNPDAVYTEDEDYYLFISNESRHAASLLGENGKNDDAALEMILEFMKLR